jgi:mono/diheme cytochrome c family protein
MPIRSRIAGLALLAPVTAACAAGPGEMSRMDVEMVPLYQEARGLPFGPPTPEQVLRGRSLVVNRDCGACHGGASPVAEDWLIGAPADQPTDSIGPIKLWARNLTPDPETGIGRYTERQIFNALRYGLRPSGTPDAVITSHVPGQGNHPARPDYLSPIMPWLWWRYMSDQELWDIAAYLKHGVRPVVHQVPANQAPADRWASQYTEEKVGGPGLPPFPASSEELRTPDRREQVLRGRHLVASSACAACHGGAVRPDQEGWLSGAQAARGAPYDEFRIAAFRTRPRNLTPDNTTGIGRFTERQIFNALRFGLRPGETPDVEITSTVPGQGNFPESPKFLAPPMPWPAWRHMSDEELRAIAAYLKHGVRPVSNRVLDSEGPPDFWASAYARFLGPYPAPPFPTAREQATP